MRLTLLPAALVFFIAAIPTGAQESSIKVSTQEQIKEDFSTVPCDDKQRLEAVKSLFERAGAPSADVTIDEHKDVANFVLTKKGDSSEKIVFGYRLTLAMVVRLDESACAAYK